MKASPVFDLSMRLKPWRSGHLRWVMQDLADAARQPAQYRRTHLHGALEWLRLLQTLQDPSWREPAWHALARIKRNQRTAGSDPALRDALPDAARIWGRAAAFKFNSLGAKHFADEPMMDMVGIAIPSDVLEKNT